MQKQKNKIDIIATKPKTNCIICNSDGKIIYNQVKDNLFNAPGLWNIKQCTNPDCGLLWLNPFPLENELKKFYKTYYTHSPAKSENKKNSILHHIYTLSNYFLGITKENNRIFSCYFNTKNTGKLLEVGCGNGERLERLKELGWDVEGQEVDPVSAKIAANRLHVKIHLGDLCKLSLKKETFDAIVINHVIEHVYDPVLLLKECYKLLKKNGQIIVITPNTKSMGHKFFREAWRGLEPPRHLHIFNSNTLSIIANIIGYKNIKSRTSFANADGLLLWSYEIKNKLLINKKSLFVIPDNLKSFLLQIIERVLIIFNKQIGEQCILIAKK